MYTKQLSTNLGCPFEGVQLTAWWCSITFNNHNLQSLFKLPKISLTFLFTPTLKADNFEYSCRLNQDIFL